MVSTPKAPDPVATANAQSGMNRDTAITQQQLNMVDQIGPDGSITYNKTGDEGFYNSQGNWVGTPKYTQTTSLSGQQQAIKDQTDAASLNLGTIASEQSSKIRDLLNTPFEYNNDDAENWAYDLGAKRLDPRFEQEREALSSRLIASGMRPGTPGYDQQMAQFGQTKNDAYNQLMLNGRQQSFTEALAQRNQPINEISALMSGSQVSMPQMNQTPQTGVAGVDYTGLVNQKYQADAAASQAKMGGLFGLLSAPFSMFKSDRRLKKDIEKVDTLSNGIPVYDFRYVWHNDNAPKSRGVMSDDVREIMPDAVHVGSDGFDLVDYAMVMEGAR